MMSKGKGRRLPYTSTLDVDLVSILDYDEDEDEDTYDYDLSLPICPETPEPTVAPTLRPTRRPTTPSPTKETVVVYYYEDSPGHYVYYYEKSPGVFVVVPNPSGSRQGKGSSKGMGKRQRRLLAETQRLSASRLAQEV